MPVYLGCTPLGQISTPANLVRIKDSANDIGRDGKVMELVSLNLRGAVLPITRFVAPVDAYLSWARHRFFHPEYLDYSQIASNPSLFDSWDMCVKLSGSVDWTDQQQASRGLRALSQLLRSAECDRFQEYEVDRIIDDVRLACKEDGFVFLEDSRTISQAGAIPLNELDLRGLSTTDGIYEKIKKINRALTNDKDNLEVIAFSKDLMEATAAAILQERGRSVEEVRDLQMTECCNSAIKAVGINNDTGSGKIADGLTLIRKALSKLVEGAGQMRREDTDEGHGMPGARFASDAQAQLALSTALLWCRYVLDKFRDQEELAPF